MTKRKIITIDEDKCNGCGECVTACAEGALQIIDGKAKLVKDNFCDGFGDCIGECPTGALTIEEREAPDFDMQATQQHIYKERGMEGVKELEEAHRKHTVGDAPSPGGGCPGLKMRMAESPKTAEAAPSSGGPKQAIPSDLQQWPIQLHLVSPAAPYFNDKELVIMSTCAPLASADMHWRFLRGRSVVVACPKLDKTEPYVDKLADILKNSTIPKAIIVRMEVPCCGGLAAIAKEAANQSGRKDLEMEEITVGVNGDVY